jgi:SOS-response transcriptional repressor LexA
MSDLTERQQEVLQFIQSHSLAKGYSPTIREICAHFGIASPNGVQVHIKALRRKGMLSETGRKQRVICAAEPCPKRIKEAFGQFSVSQLKVCVKSLNELISEKLASS